MFKNNKNMAKPYNLDIKNLLFLYKSEQFKIAEELALSILKKLPKEQLALKILGAIFGKTGRLKEAFYINKKVVKLFPNDAEAHNNLGVILKGMNKIDEAKKNYERAIILKSDFVEAHRNLVNLKKFNFEDEQFLEMQKIYLNNKISNEQKCHINFALAKANEDLKNFSQAFQHYKQGNMLCKKILNYDIQNDIETFKQIKFNYQKLTNMTIKFENLINGNVPIFIIGMPRSGTTLVEQIISSHSKVTAGGELPYIDELGPKLSGKTPEINLDILVEFRHNYLDKLSKISEGNNFVTDKMTSNFLNVGLITTAFPEAKIINVSRNPAAVCWANYKRYFSSSSMAYSFDLEDIVSYYKLYEELINFWEKKLPNRIYHLDYERLVNNQTDETKNLIKYLTLNWEKECLSPQDNKRIVATASNIQVRKPIYQDSSQQWINFKPFLNGVFDKLEN